MNLRRLIGTAAATAIVATGLASCTSLNVSAGYGAAFLTGWDNDRYDVVAAGDWAQVSAPAERNSNNQRIVFWNWAGQPSADQEVCANFAASTHGENQEGVALRVVSANGRTQAITVTKNVFGGAFNAFNMHVWDTARGGDLPASHFAQFWVPHLGADPGHPAPLPWRMCAKVVGEQVSFVVWPHSVAPPAYGDPAWGGSASLPAGAPTYGMPGGYAGHIQPGGHVVYNAVTSVSL